MAFQKQETKQGISSLVDSKSQASSALEQCMKLVQDLSRTQSPVGRPTPFSADAIEKLAVALQKSDPWYPWLARSLAIAAERFVPPNETSRQFWTAKGQVHLRVNPKQKAEAAIAFAMALRSGAPHSAEPAEDPKQNAKENGKETEKRSDDSKKPKTENEEPTLMATTGGGRKKTARRMAKATMDIINSFLPVPEQGRLLAGVANLRLALENTEPKVLSEQTLPLSAWIRSTRIVPWKTPDQVDRKLHIFNPSIIPHPDKPSTHFLLNFRLANYRIRENNTYEPSNLIMTQNLLAEMPVDFEGSEFDPSWCKPLSTPDPAFPYKEISGLEDLRLLHDPVSKRLFATFTSLEMDAAHTVKMGIAELDATNAKVKSKIVALSPCLDQSESRQKNWTMFALDGRLFAIYMFSPLIVMQVLPETGETQLVDVNITTVRQKWRGSSPLVLLPDAVRDRLLALEQRNRSTLDKPAPLHQTGDLWYACLVHVSDFPRYSHAFVVLRVRRCPSGSFKPLEVDLVFHSRPFVFFKHDIEFSCGLALSPDGSTFVIPFSVRDADAYCARVPVADMFSRLSDNFLPDDLVGL